MINNTTNSQKNLNNNSESDSSSVSPKVVKLSNYMNNNNPILNTPPTNINSNMQSPMDSDTTKPKKKLNLKMVLGVVVLLLVVLGSGAGFYLSQQQQDLRQQAATDSIACGRITCSDGTTADYDCNYSGSCGDRVNAVCGIDDTNAYQDVAPEICTRGDDDDSYNCSSCVGSCGSTGCNTNCDGNTNPKTDCNIWSAGFVCEGRSRSGCNENNGSSSLPDPLDYANNPETWCKSYQFDSNAPNGAYSVVFVGDGGEVCVTIGGQPDTCNPDDLDWDCSSAPSSGDVSNACTPNQKWSEDGSLLSYDFTISNIQGEGNFDRSSFFFSFPGEKTRDQQMLIQFLGTPTWASDGTGSCNETNWCGYLIHTQETVSGTTASYTWTTNASNQPMIGGNQRSLKDISTFSRDTLDRPFRPKVEVNLVMGGVQTDSIGGFNIDVFPDACAQPAQSISKTWNITTEFICPDSTIPTEIGRRLFFLVWPPEPKVFNYNPKLDFGNGSTTSISQSITVDNITSDLIQNVYVGLVDASYFHTWWNDGDDNLETYLPISSYPGVVAGDFFSEPMYKWSVTDDSVPTNMTLQFEAPPELCEGEITLTCNDSCTPPATGETDQCSIDINENHSCINNKCRLISNPDSPTCNEALAPMCIDVAILDVRNNDNELLPDGQPPLYAGQVIAFRCASEDLDSQTDHYEFRITEPDGTIITGSSINPTSNGSRSQNYTIPSNGSFGAQCRICTSATQCQDYIPIN